ncbi:MAG: hypothetical protein RJA76_1627 [Bacteroidota bacterium]|jgi:outer membrane protein TolC
MKCYNKKIIFGLLLFGSFLLNGQKFDLETCKIKARSNFPLIKQLGILDNLKELSLENLSKGYLPQINFNAQGTYQSEVTSVPISLPNLTIKGLDKDQYRTYLEIYQPLIDGQMVKKQQEVSKSQFAVDHQKIEVELYKLFASVNQLYFGILLIDSQIKSTNSLLSEVESNAKKLQIGVQEGIVNPLNKEIFEAEKIKIIQRLDDLLSTRRSLLNTLGITIGETIPVDSKFDLPPYLNQAQVNKRPELALYDLQIGQLDQQKNLIRNKLSPRIGLMAQIGYGRPALNMLNNDFKEYYIGGLKLSWSISSFYTNARERKVLEGQQAMISAQREVFNQQTAIGAAQVQNDLNKWDSLLHTDEQLIATRKRIIAAANIQFTQGTLSSLDYLAFLNQLEQAQQQLLLHQLQKLQSVYQQQYLLGN